MNKNLFSIIFLTYLVFFSGCDRNPDDFMDGQPDIRAAKRGIGVSANELLSDQRFTSLELEIQYMSGFMPTEEMVDHIGNWLTDRIHKPLGITISLKEIPAAGKEKYSVVEIREVEDNHRTVYNEGERFGAYMLVLDGYFEEDEDREFSLGVAHRNSSVALFGKRIRENSDRLGRPSRERLESTVALHEMGHLLGLVDLGSPMVEAHEDSEHLKHCDEEDCLMYWAVETSTLFSRSEVELPQLDENCLNDLRGNGGR